MFSLSPPIPIKRTNYVCDKQFHLHPIKELYTSIQDGEGHYALLILNARESGFWRVNDLETRCICTFQTTINKSHKKGGQSQARIGRLHDNKRQHNHSYIAERLLREFWDTDQNKLREGIHGFIVGGSAETRLKVLEQPELKPLQRYVITNRPFSTPTSGLDDGQAYRLWLETEEERMHWENEGEAAILTTIQTLFQTEPDRLEFGEHELDTGLRQYLYERVYYEEGHVIASFEPKHKECQFIRLSADAISAYGGCIGLKWYHETQME